MRPVLMQAKTLVGATALILGAVLVTYNVMGALTNIVRWGIDERLWTAIGVGLLVLGRLLKRAG
jgi:hypothetical protein